MSYLISRYGTPIKIDDSGHMISFFNDYVQQKAYDFYDETETKVYSIPANYSETVDMKKYPFLQYRSSFPTARIKQTCNAVLYFDGVIGQNGTYLYETINASAVKNPQDSIANISFWSNLANNQTVILKDDGSSASNVSEIANVTNIRYRYESSKILRIAQDEIETFLSSSGTYRRIFCQAYVQFHFFYVVDATETIDENFFNDRELECVPCIFNKPIILDEFTDNQLILDFVNSDGGSSGQGLKQHMHIPNVDPQSSNYAAAVFMPGSGAPAYPWKI